MRIEKLFTDAEIAEVATHWTNCGHLMEKIISEELLDFALTKEYTPAEMKAYRNGLAEVASKYAAASTYLSNKQRETKEQTQSE